MIKLVVFTVVCMVILNASHAVFGQHSSHAGAEVTIGGPEFISYEKAFPFLDAFSRDALGIQMSNLTIDPDAINGTSYDAMLQQFQFSLQYSQTLGLQNATIAQQNSAFSNSMANESTFMAQEIQLSNMAITAQQQILDAQSALNALPTTATAEQKAAAQQLLDSARANLTMINTQIATVKGLRANSLASGSFSTPLPSPAPIASPAITPPNPPTGKADAFGPSSSPSKRMERYINLLSERQALLVDALLKDQDGGNMYLVKFSTGINVGKEQKKQPVLTTQYSIGCQAPAAGHVISGSPRILDLYPRSSELNIADEKYKDSRVGLSLLLSFFSVGANASYNREHLQVTQSLSQSAYITGFGIQTDTFGWIFGPTLGEQIPTQGSRTTYALVSLPDNCDPTVSLVDSVWGTSPSIVAKPAGGAAFPGLAALATSGFAQTQPPPACTVNHTCITRISYSSADFDLANPSASQATSLTLRFADKIDREQLVSVNGLPLKRARDTFGRATASSTGTAGFLQSDSVQKNSWFPISDREIALSLDPSLFDRRFPQITFLASNQTLSLSKEINSTMTQIDVDGNVFICPESAFGITCASALPSSGHPKLTPRKFLVARREAASGNPTDTHIVFKLDEPILPSKPLGNATSFPTVELATTQTSQPWSGDARVRAMQGGNEYSLLCSPDGEYLNCTNPNPTLATPLDLSRPTRFQISDYDFAGSPLRTFVDLRACLPGSCNEPIIWQNDDPKWSSATNSWQIHLEFANVANGDSAQLMTSYGVLIGASAPFAACSTGNICSTDIDILPGTFDKINDRMLIRVVNPVGNQKMEPRQLLGLKSAISPIILDINKDQTVFSGLNLPFQDFYIDKKKSIKLKCTVNIQGLFNCKVVAPGFAADDSGFLYFKAGSEFVAFNQFTDKGFQLVPQHEKAKPETPTATAAKAAVKPTTPVINPDLIKSLTRVFNFPIH